MNLTLSGQLLEELHKRYRYLRVVADEQDGRPILQASKNLQFTGNVGGINFNNSSIKWDTIPVSEPPPGTRTVVEIYPNRIWDIEELL